jgi:hypothetical protein
MSGFLNFLSRKAKMHMACINLYAKSVFPDQCTMPF